MAEVSPPRGKKLIEVCRRQSAGLLLPVDASPVTAKLIESLRDVNDPAGIFIASREQQRTLSALFVEDN